MSILWNWGNKQDETYIQRHWWLIFVPVAGLPLLYWKYFFYIRKRPSIYAKSVVEMEGLRLLYWVLLTAPVFAAVILLNRRSAFLPEKLISLLQTGVAYIVYVAIGASLVWMDKKYRKGNPGAERNPRKTMCSDWMIAIAVLLFIVGGAVLLALYVMRNAAPV